MQKFTFQASNRANLQAPGKMEGSKPLWFILYVCFHILGVSAVVLVGIWMGEYEGGFSWRSGNPGTQFNYHPLLMTFGLIYLNANAALLYRVFRTQPKMHIKILHASVQAVAFILMVIATKAAFDSHDLRLLPIPNLYSLHSWIGLFTVVLFSLQLVFGFISFLFPKLNDQFRKLYLPIHVFFGVTIFALAVATALTGVTEKLIFGLGPQNYSLLPTKAILGNTYGVVIILFAMTTISLLVNSNFKRPPDTQHRDVSPVGRHHAKYTVNSDFKPPQ